MKFKVGDIIKCKGSYFDQREIMDIDHEQNKYKTRFLDDESIVESCATVIDYNNWKVR